MDFCRRLFQLIRHGPHAWRMVTIDIAAVEAEHAVVAICDAQLQAFRHVIVVLRDIEQVGGDALLELPAAADLIASMVCARMEAVSEVLIADGPPSHSVRRVA